MATEDPGAQAALMAEHWERVAPYATYRRMANEGLIGFQHCTDCASAIFPPRVLCPGCGGLTLEWRVSAGYGTVYSTTTLFERGSDPYNVSLIDLAEGIRLMSRVEGLPSEEVAIGLEVRASVRTLDGATDPLIVCEALKAGI